MTTDKPSAAEPARRVDPILLVAILATALSLGPALAHLMEMPAKLTLDREAYFVVQDIYRGWNRIAAVLAIQLGAYLAALWRWRRQPALRRPLVVALLALAAAQAVFWIWTFPANAATDDWTRIPQDWQQLRAQWEWSHAAGALLQFTALAAVTVAALRRP